MKLRTLLLLFVITTFSNINAQNLLVNGDFEQGYNVGYQGGQTPNYSYIAQPYSGSTSAGNWAIYSNPKTVNTLSFVISTDHSGTGNMMIVDGTGVDNQSRFWKAGNNGGGICGLTVGTTYTFSYWIRSIFNTVGGTLANIGVQFNNANNVTRTLGTTLAPLTAAGWQKVEYTFTATNACVNIEMFNNIAVFAGNDFAIDDMSLTAPPKPLDLTYSVVNGYCQILGSIVAYGIEGVTPYSYTLNGGANPITNTTGIFNNLQSGTYSITVTDSNGGTKTKSGIQVTSPDMITLTNPSTICQGDLTSITASGGSNYLWTADPVDTGLTSPTSPTIVVSPAVTTTYSLSVGTQPAPANLIFNGDFSAGNVGFVTQYAYTANNNAGLQRAYGIVTTANSWEASFGACTDHTGAGGKMMIADGSIFNNGNDVVWRQVVPVEQNKTYTFGYWVQITALNNPAKLETFINNVSLGIQIPPGTPTCNWVYASYTWNSGTNTTADISIFDREIAPGGNDFAIDDISLIGTTGCVGPSVKITVNQKPVVTDTISSLTACKNAASPVISLAVPPTTANLTYTYFINGGANQTVTTSSPNVPATISVPTNNAGTFLYTITSVSYTDNGQTCTFNQSPVIQDSVVINNQLAASIAIDRASACQDQVRPSITFTGVNGVPPYTFFYTVNGGSTQTISSTAPSSIAYFQAPVSATGTYVYALTGVTDSTGNNCTLPISGSVSYLVKPLPVATITTIPLTQTVCPNNPAVFSVQGTPNAIVSFNNTYDSTPTTIQLDASGNGQFISEVLLNQGVFTYYLEAVALVSSSCTRVYTTRQEFVVTVVANGCATAVGGDINIDGTINPNPHPICNFNGSVNCTTLKVKATDIASTSKYKVSKIPYCPQAPFVNTGGNWQSLYPDDITGDDEWSTPFLFPGATATDPAFQFCFFGNAYTKLNVGSNGVITFNLPATHSFCEYNFNQLTIPNINFPIKNAIYGVYQDTDYTKIPPYSPLRIATNYSVQGEYPCRKFIVNFANLPQFGTGCNVATVGLQTSQIVLYEVSNIVEVYIERRVPCTTWQQGEGVVGIMNAAGTLGYAPTPGNCAGCPNRNTGGWSATQEAYRFSPDGPNVPITYQWKDENGVVVSNANTVTVCPTATTTYTATASYLVCGVTQKKSIPVTVSVSDGGTIAPNGTNLVQCSNLFDFTSNYNQFFDGLNEVFFYTSNQDAIAGANPIDGVPTAFYSTGQTIYVRINFPGADCNQIRTFQLIPTGSLGASINVGATSSNSVQFSWLSLLGASSYIVSYQINGGAIVNVGDIGNLLTYTVSCNPLDVVKIIVTPVATNPQACFVSTNQTGTAQACTPATAVISSDASTVCLNGTQPTISFTATGGAAPFTFSYKVNSGATQTINTSATSNTATIPLDTSVSGTTIYNLLDVSYSNPACTQTQPQTLVVTVLPAPQATIAVSNAGICEGGTSTVTFTGSQGLPPYTFSYDLNGSVFTVSTTTTSSIAAITVPNGPGTYNYTLQSIQSTTTPVCSNVVTGVKTVVVDPLPTATISGTVTLCSGNSSTITFTGTPNAVVTYSIDGGANQTVTLNSSGTASVQSPVLTSNSVYTLVDITSNVSVPCNVPLTGNATITVVNLPTATIASDSPLCSGSTSTITFTGTPNAVVTYLDATNTSRTVTLDGLGSAQVTSPVLTADATYSLVSIELVNPTSTCSANLTGSTTVTVLALPTANLAVDQPAVCQNGISPVLTFTGSGSVAPYTFTYTLDAGSPQTVTTSGTNNTATVSVPTGSNGTFTYNLVNVQSSSNPVCSQTVSVSVPVTVLALPAASLSADVSAVCQNGTSAVLTFTGSGGVSPYTFSYTANGSSQTLSSIAGQDAVTFSVPTNASGTQTYVLTGVSSSTSPACSQTQSSTTTITIEPLPTATIGISTAAVCINGISPVVTFTGASGVAPYTFTYTDPSGTTQSVTSTGATATVSVPTNSPSILTYTLQSVTSAGALACSQAQTGSVTTEVIGTPTANIPPAYEVCDDNNDGYSCLFNLSTLQNTIVGGNNSLQVSFHETQTDAQNGVNTLPLNTYCNINPFQQDIFVRVFNPLVPQCPTVINIALKVNNRPMPPAVIDPLQLCDINSTGDGFEAFDLSLQDNIITSGQSGLTVTYFATQADAQANTAVLSLPFTNTTANQQTIWFRLQKTSTGCFSVGSFNIIVNPLPATPTTAVVQNACSLPTDATQALFVLSTNNAVLTQSINGMQVAYFASLSDAQTGTNPLADNYTSASTTVTALVTNTNTGCTQTMPVQLQVVSAPALTAPTPLAVCDDDENDGFSCLFVLNAKDSEITGGQTGLVVTYHETQTDAQNGVNALVSPYCNINPTTQTVYVRVINPGAPDCYSMITLEIKVDAKPIVAIPSVPYALCDDDTDGSVAFDLTGYGPTILDTLLPADYTVSYYLTEAEALAGTGALTGTAAYVSISKTIYVRVQNNLTGCFKVVPLALQVNPLPILPFPLASYNLCDYVTLGDNQEPFDLDGQSPLILNGQTGIAVSFYQTAFDAQGGDLSTSIPSPYTAGPVQTIHVRAQNTTTGCFRTSTMDIRVNPLPQLVPMTLPLTVCDSDQDGV
ncbi:MAG: hypothetical protein CFE24_05745, partial [Flavobacterium sp. BFFFF2]